MTKETKKTFKAAVAVVAEFTIGACLGAVLGHVANSAFSNPTYNLAEKLLVTAGAGLMAPMLLDAAERYCDPIAEWAARDDYEEEEVDDSDLEDHIKRSFEIMDT